MCFTVQAWDRFMKNTRMRMAFSTLPTAGKTHLDIVETTPPIHSYWLYVHFVNLLDNLVTNVGYNDFLWKWHTFVMEFCKIVLVVEQIVKLFVNYIYERYLCVCDWLCEKRFLRTVYFIDTICGVNSRLENRNFWANESAQKVKVLH